MDILFGIVFVAALIVVIGVLFDDPCASLEDAQAQYECYRRRF